jgi:hypothetical protein
MNLPQAPMKTAGIGNTPGQSAYFAQRANIQQQSNLTKTGGQRNRRKQKGGIAEIPVTTITPAYSSTLTGGQDISSQQVQQAGTFNKMATQMAGDNAPLIKKGGKKRKRSTKKKSKRGKKSKKAKTKRSKK